MSVPAQTDPRWQRALTGAEPKVSSLATRLLITRLRDDVRRDPKVLGPCITQLHGFFVANSFAARDLAAL
ncbi:hypothetical protein [Acidocella sp.]|uniref:hypothetical protein n=1 Tax=Acidocella sp. TaxID=50710 RepID=UPI00263564F2|nr:hypothetical protein [Acidocella sp.]